MKFNYIDLVTTKILIYSIIASIVIPYYFIAGGTLLGFVLVRIVATFFSFCGQIGWHRWLTHRSFEPSLLGKVFMFLGMLFSGAGSPLRLVVAHRQHHAYSDTEQDPHSPKYHSFLNLWLGRYTVNKSNSIPREFFKDKFLVFFNKHYWKLYILINILFLLIDFKTALIFCPVTVVYTWTIVNLVNYYGHKDRDVIGPRDVDSKFLIWFSGGEALQFTHHNNPTNYSFGSKDKKDPCEPLVKYLLMK